MGDREREKGKQKVVEYEEFGESSEGASWRTTRSPGGEDGADGNPSLPPLDPRDDQSRVWPQPQQQPTAQGGGEEGDPVRQQMEYLISQVPSIMAHIRAALDSDELRMGPDTLTSPAWAGTPSSSSQMNFALDGTQTEAQPAATVDGQRGAAATGASGSRCQPWPPANPGVVVQCPACHDNPDADRCLICGTEPAALAIDPRQLPQPHHPPQQRQPQHPAAPTSQLDVLVGQQLTWNPFSAWLPLAEAGWHNHLQVPEHQRCPGCCYYPGQLAAEPMQHVCLCNLCRLLPFFCPFCWLRTPPKGES